MNDNAIEPAFPIVESNIREGNLTMEPSSFGLTKREYAAIMAMQSCISRANMLDSTQDVVEWAVKYADKLLEELEKPHNSPKQPTT